MRVRLCALGPARMPVRSCRRTPSRFPPEPITIVVPAAPGGVATHGAAGRAALHDRVGQQVIVENRGGANHAIGAAMVGKAAPDGHSMMVAAETVFVINPTLHAGKLPYDVKDFAPVTGLVRINQGLLAHRRCRPTPSPN